jgi:Ni/Co efflux regulator RcnB
MGCIASTIPASAQQRWDNHGGSRNDNRGGGQNRWHNYGGSYGYNGYHGRWRTGQRFNNWNNSRYYVNDWRAYNLPPPRRGYRYYRDDNGDIVMAAIGTGIIGLILGSQLGR